MENPSLREFNNNQSPRFLTRRYVHYFYTLTTVCEKCIHTSPSAPGGGAPTLSCWRSNQIQPISPARLVAAFPAPRRCSLFFKTYVQSVWPKTTSQPTASNPGQSNKTGFR